jgi:hypothetical protein
MDCLVIPSRIPVPIRIIDGHYKLQQSARTLTLHGDIAMPIKLGQLVLHRSRSAAITCGRLRPEVHD